MKSVTNNAFLTTLATIVGICCLSTSNKIFAVDCYDTITTPVTLNQDLSCDTSSTPALIISGPSGSLNLNGHSVNCDALVGTGIFLDGTAASVYNGEVFNCQNGIQPDGNGFHNIQNISTYSNTYGIYLTGNNNSITQTTIFKNSLAIYVIGDNNSILFNDINNNSGTGIFIDSNTTTKNENTLVSQNTIYQNSFSGILIGQSNSNLIVQNRIYENGTAGIGIDTGGIVLINLNQSNNRIIGNSVIDNVIYDLIDENVDACSSSNIWSGNIFGSASPSCLD
ncbi:right-handed parallel beta-helix repeat-containing protein [Microbulbifer sp. OS29]|uniref:Right-handed parallel beta-helix repeat-containing protein n=1 Tax=Microbulbifer okhotskensis TaxID=2926617 RepID=A0A9X2EUS5_9GAMM|nr:right-handed parallel beta-helix repeat-containing protein [Microbulbifer okhotskensis]MCO1336278.1 right-handed parallel beta-helix repeat-containing protein [Microbulbifer okhotskensis]